MPDICDMAQDIIEQELVRNLARAQRPYTIADGVAGECEICGNLSSRLILGVCAQCRDERGLP